MMKVLWVNPSFFDYRVSFYKAINELCGGNFHLVYSKERVPDRCISKIEAALGKNAHGLEQERQLAIGDTKSGFSCRSITIPFPKGLNSLLNTIKADVVIAEGFFQWTPWAIVYACRWGVPLYVAYERTQHTERNCPMWRSWYRRVINCFVDGYLVNGSLCSNYLQNSLRIGKKQIVEGIMAADSKTLAEKVEEISESRVRFHHGGIKFLYVGRLIAVKGVEYLLNAWQIHVETYKDDSLIIVGDGPEFDKLSLMIAKNVSFVGAVDYDLIHQYYSKADVFVIPTLEDNWSLVVPEAMSCGLPVACSCYNGCHPELIKEGVNGTVFDPLKQDSIVSALAYFHQVDLKMMGEKSREIEWEYSPDKCAGRAYRGILKSLEKD